MDWIRTAVAFAVLAASASFALADETLDAAVAALLARVDARTTLLREKPAKTAAERRELALLGKARKQAGGVQGTDDARGVATLGKALRTIEKSGTHDGDVRGAAAALAGAFVARVAEIAADGRTDWARLYDPASRVKVDRSLFRAEGALTLVNELDADAFATRWARLLPAFRNATRGADLAETFAKSEEELFAAPIPDELAVDLRADPWEVANVSFWTVEFVSVRFDVNAYATTEDGTFLGRIVARDSQIRSLLGVVGSGLGSFRSVSMLDAPSDRAADVLPAAVAARYVGVFRFVVEINGVRSSFTRPCDMQR